ncbi:hypothetical protein [Phytomonospora endophytica]|uniref:Uncharacterized protein n=1 Tax=Phytomonospora endophytica TaxID=714109 RepID=A0A841FW70_9ACTN|nr:hypothetical protein [Phytomonospora endophytica]MBB6037782.1 hypothetical protein [Phytomonospora endophytica]GIG67688.1 hypothetical protein Pen01_39830 [Phytomonospora endophytica]
MTESRTGGEAPKTLPDWGLEPPQWIDEHVAPGVKSAETSEVDPGGEGDPDPAEQLTWRSEANNPWSLDDDEEMPPPVVGGDEDDGI